MVWLFAVGVVQLPETTTISVLLPTSRVRRYWKLRIAGRLAPGEVGVGPTVITVDLPWFKA